MTSKLVLRNKCLIFGNATVGKTALVQTFHSDGTQYPKTYGMTIHADVCVKPVNIPDTNVTIEMFIFDLAGHDVFQEYLSKYCKSASSFILVYDTTNADSFKALPKWIQFIRQIKDLRHGCRGVLVATKTDQSFRRAVPTQQGEEFAKQHNLVFFECSAATNTDVEAPFYYVANAFHELFEENLRVISKATAEMH
ncbi:P-loop containing nucleoside triphosphate hydrolase protein [Entophlyctis helioformis]|nr:P-loop containing nucleoside triphosphate hydrolase protein [Entophlyctis helioformis]